MSLSELLRWQWAGYPRYHQSRANLLVHIIVVPVFLLGNIGLVVAIARASWPLGAVGVIAMVTSMALQGLGHRRESVPPEPFKGPLNAVLRIVCEQWVTFPRFMVSGGWSRAWGAAKSV
jgi:2-hydroxy-palmitic acid dioxygenase Mpo1-like